MYLRSYYYLIKYLGKDDVIMCTVHKSDKGYQISQIKSVISHGKFSTNKKTQKVSAIMKKEYVPFRFSELNLILDNDYNEPRWMDTYILLYKAALPKKSPPVLESGSPDSM